MALASAEKFKHTGPAEKERVASVPQREQLARTSEPPLPKGKGTEPSVQSTRSWRGESRGGREPHLGERGRDQSESMERKGRFQGGERGQATRASLEGVEGSMSGRVDAKALQDDLQSLSFTTSLAKPEIVTEVGGRRARS